ncbi:MAG: hypothetical protein FIA92_15545 [Chloroflexi bacterium]|nr:hypothetical protein [Chloroflexota bacterium]
MAAITIVPTVAAQDEPASVNPCYDGAIFAAEPYEAIDLVCGWGVVGGPGKIVSFLNSHTASVTVRDAGGNVVVSIEPEELASLWTGPFWWDADDEWVDCAGPRGGAVAWVYQVPGGLPAGIYQVTYEETLTHPVNDGYHTCWMREDGSRLVSAPSLWWGSFTAISTLVVAE